MNNHNLSSLKNLISNELKLTVLLSRPVLDKNKIELAQGLLTDIDFDKFQELVKHHRVWPCVYCNVRDYLSDKFPVEFTTWLERKYKQNVKQTQLQFKSLFEVIYTLKKRGVAVVPLKGIPLAQKLYGDIAKRQSNDVDVIIQPQELEKAHKELVKAGFTCSLYENLTSTQKKIYFGAHKDLPYRSSAGILIELHIRLSAHETPLTSKYKQTLFLQNTEDAAVYDELLYLSWHASHTLFHRLKWLVDIALYLENKDMVTDQFSDNLLKRSKDLDAERSLICSLILSSILFGTRISQDILMVFDNDRKAQWMVKKSLQALNDPINVQGVKFKFDKYFSELLSPKSTKSVWFSAIQKMKPDIGDIKMLSWLPDRLSFLCYLLRPFTLLIRLIAVK